MTKSSCSKKFIALFRFSTHVLVRVSIWACTKSIIHFKKFLMGFMPLETSVDPPQFFTIEWKSKANLIESRVQKKSGHSGVKYCLWLSQNHKAFYYVYDDHKKLPSFSFYSIFSGMEGYKWQTLLTHEWRGKMRSSVKFYSPKKKCFSSPNPQNHDKNP